MSEDNGKILVEMFQRAFNANEKGINLLGLDVMCALIREDSTVIGKVIELLLEKIKSDDVVQSLKGLEMLGECMSKCGDEFQNKVSKFHFLNRLIEMVSMKCSGNKTPPEIRNKIMEYLWLWSDEYPDKKKIKDAYDRLFKENIKHKCTTSNAIVIPAAGRKCTFLDSKTEEKIRKLINSGNPDDLERANSLIRYCVDQDAKRNELLMQQKDELKKAENTINLLCEMIHRNSDGIESTSDDQDTLKELYNHCLKLLPIIQKLPEIIDVKEEETVAEALRINDELLDVLKRYENLSVAEKNSTTIEPENSEELLTNAIDTKFDNTNALQSSENAAVSLNNATKAENIIDDLKDIFFDTPKVPDNVTLAPLEPIPVYKGQKDEEQKIDPRDDTTEIVTSNNGFLSYVDKLSEELFKENLKTNTRVGNFKKKPEKVSLNEMKRKSSDESGSDENLKMKLDENKSEEQEYQNSSKIELSPTQNYGILDVENIEFLLNNMKIQTPKIYDDDNTTLKTEMNKESKNMEMETESCLSEDEEIIGDNIAPSSSDMMKISDPFIRSDDNKSSNDEIKTSKNLYDISLELSSIKGSKDLPIMKVMDDVQGLRIVFNFAKDRPNEDTFVIVISIVNQGQFPIKNFHLEAGVSKPCRLRLLSPTATHLSGVEPFQLPTEDIKQILLLYNPTKQHVDITCIVTYNLSDEIDQIKEPILVKHIPYLNV